jgi:excinuclease UvrABC helicase subunit UvrB
MYSLARDLEFEKAAQMRDEIAKLKEVHFGVSTKAA